MRDQVKTSGDISLQHQHQSVVAGAIIGTEYGQARSTGVDRETGRVAIAAITVIALLVHVVGADGPVRVKRALDSGGNVNRVRSFVVGIDQSAGGAGLKTT